MRYCEGCGTGHDCAAEENGAEKAEVAIERLRTTRDIEVARINAAAGIQISETEAEQQTAHADGVIEGVETVLDAVTGGGDATEGEPIVVTTEDPVPEPETEIEPEIEAPPEVPEVPAGSGNDAGWWNGYR